MSILMQINPFDFLTDKAGDALDEGYVWIGQVNKDPRSFPLTVYIDANLSIPAAQPLRTQAGYVTRSNAPTYLYVPGRYSVLVQDKTGAQVYYVPDVLPTASSVFYTGPDGNTYTIQDLSSSGSGKGASIIFGAAKHIPSIAALRAEPGLYDGQPMEVDSYYSGGNGLGGGLFRWNSASSTADDGGAYIKNATQATGRWLRVFRDGPISATMWGMQSGQTSNQVEPAKKALAYAAANKIAVVSLVPGDVSISLETVPAFFGAGLIMPTGVFLDLRGTRLILLPTTSAGYSGLLFKEDCLLGGVFGGEIVGERDGHLGTTGEFGMGVNIRAAKNIFVKDIKISKCWGDCVYLGADTTGNQATYAEYISLQNITGDNARRNGMSIANARNVIGDGLVFSNTIGTSPQAGIDIEPDLGGTIQNIQLGKVHCFGNAGAGYMSFASITATNPLTALTIKGVTIDNLICNNNAGPGVQASLCSDLTIGNIQTFNNGQKGMIVEACLRAKFGMINSHDNTVTGTFSRGDITITGSQDVQLGPVAIANANGTSAIIVRGSNTVQFGPVVVDNCTMVEAAIQIEVGSTDVSLPDTSINGVSGYGIYADNTCSGVRLGGGRLRDIGRTQSNAVAILNQSPGAVITGFSLTNSGATKPLNGVVSSGASCIVHANYIPGAQVSSGSGGAIMVTGGGSISANNITA